MRIGLVNETEYERSKSLWAACFPEDNEDFIRVYYALRSRPEFTLAAFDGADTPIAMMHMLPFDMELDGAAEPVCFVAGVCTAPRYRGQGICTALFDRALVHMRERGFSYCLLSPSDPRFYSRLGFKTFFETKLLHISYDRTNSFVQSADIARRSSIPSFLPSLTPDSLCALYERLTNGMNGRLIRTPEYFRAFLAEFSLPGAYMKISDLGCCAGYSSSDGTKFEAVQLFFSGDDFTHLLPEGFTDYAVPLPNSAHIPDIPGGKRFVTRKTAQMIRPVLKPLPDLSRPYYGFDSY